MAKRKYNKRERTPAQEAALKKKRSEAAKKRWAKWKENKATTKAQTPVPQTSHDSFKKLNVSMDYSPTPAQWRFSEAIRQGARVVLFLGGIRAGKTYAGAREALKQIYKYNRFPNLGWIISPTYPMSQVPERMFKAYAGDLVAKHLKGERAFLMVPPKSMPNNYYRVEVKSAEEPDRLRGPSLGWVWIDEGAMISKDCWDILLGRVLDSKGIIFITTTPRGRNWLYEDVYLRSEKDERYVCLQAPTAENPHLDPKEVENLRTRYSGEFAKQELDAEFMSFEGLVYKGYKPPYHHVKRREIPQNAEIVCGVDFGYNDPFVCLWLAKWDNVWHVVDEHYQNHKTIDYHIRVIKEHPLYDRVVKYWGDPSAAQGRADLRASGINIYPAIKTQDKGSRKWIHTGIQEVTRWLNLQSPNGDPRFEVWKNCVNTNAEFMQYRYRESKMNSGEIPVDVSNHAMDALRYAITSESRTRGDFHPRYPDDKGNAKIMTSKDKLNNTLSEYFSHADKNKTRQGTSIFPSWYMD